MSIPQQSIAPAAAATKTDDRRLLDEILDKSIEYKPFLSEEQIQLTPRMVLRFMCKPTKSGKRATMEQALHFCMLCKARGLNPWEGDAYLVGYDTQDGPEFSLITAHQAFLKRAEVHPEYDGMKSGVIVKRGGKTVEEEGDFYEDGDVLLGGWANVKFKNRSTPVYKRLRLATFNKGYSRWKIDPAGMIVKCAEGDALRSAFPNSLGGMYLEDEMPGGASLDRVTEAASDDEKFTEDNLGFGDGPITMPQAASEQQPQAAPAPEQSNGVSNDVPITAGQIKVVRARMKAGALADADLCKRFQVNAIEQLKAAQVNQVLSWIKDPTR